MARWTNVGGHNHDEDSGLPMQVGQTKRKENPKKKVKSEQVLDDT
jgi:hypothetical protein